jgi:phosphatidylserine/phosphatidylglycerophosphate/cardiolipin synthase-like enzyme
MSVDIKVLTTAQYFDDVTKRLHNAKKGERVSATAMTFDPDEPRVAKYMNALIRAAQKGASVLLLIDAHSFMLNHYTDAPNGPLLLHQNIQTYRLPYYRKKVMALEKLKQAGVGYAIINKPKGAFINPIAGRSHIKTTVMGDYFYIGGCNLSGTGELDLMLSCHGGPGANYLHDFLQRVAKKGDTRTALHYHDQELALDSETSLLIDCGVRQQSIIFDQAMELIDAADEWLVMTCQFFPNSVTARHLAAAKKRGVKIKLFYNHPSKHAHINKLAHQLVIWQERTRNPKELFANEGTRKQPRIHAKLIATENGAIIGSNNYVTAGVKLGTAESAILRRNPQFATRAAKVMQKQIEAGE